MADASHFLRSEFHGSGWQMAGMPLLAGLLCAANFAIGRKIGGVGLGREASQSLGQKNTMLTIWLAVKFLNPLVALGPVCYVLCHNGYNAWQLARSGRGK
jgi:BASS family bile acid:Na+ symporter